MADQEWQIGNDRLHATCDVLSMYCRHTLLVRNTEPEPEPEPESTSALHASVMDCILVRKAPVRKALVNNICEKIFLAGIRLCA